MYLKLIFKQTINNKQMYSPDCTNTEILMYFIVYIHIHDVSALWNENEKTRENNP